MLQPRTSPLGSAKAAATERVGLPCLVQICTAVLQTTASSELTVQLWAKPPACISSL